MYIAKGKHIGGQRDVEQRAKRMEGPLGIEQRTKRMENQGLLSREHRNCRPLAYLEKTNLRREWRSRVLMRREQRK